MEGLKIEGEVTSEQAWAAFLTADKEKEVEDIRKVCCPHDKFLTLC